MRTGPHRAERCSAAWPATALASTSQGLACAGSRWGRDVDVAFTAGFENARRGIAQRKEGDEVSLRNIDGEVAAVCYAIYRDCVDEKTADRALNAYLWRAVVALERCPPELKQDLERELLRIADRLGLYSEPQTG
jgi:hypothetical protein